MSTWISRLVEQERCVLTAADVWARAMTDSNRQNKYFALGVGFPEGSLGDEVLQLPDYGFFDVSSGILVVKDERFIVLAQSRAPFCSDNYLARLVGEGGYRDSRFTFSGDIYPDYRHVSGISGGAQELIAEFDVKRHTVGSVRDMRNRGWHRSVLHFA